ncbi:hypothetical protein ACTXT7_012296 [Hymenolepis weldensis]
MESAMSKVVRPMQVPHDGVEKKWINMRLKKYRKQLLNSLRKSNNYKYIPAAPQCKTTQIIMSKRDARFPIDRSVYIMRHLEP